MKWTDIMFDYTELIRKLDVPAWASWIRMNSVGYVGMYQHQQQNIFPNTHDVVHKFSYKIPFWESTWATLKSPIEPIFIEDESELGMYASTGKSLLMVAENSAVWFRYDMKQIVLYEGDKSTTFTKNSIDELHDVAKSFLRMRKDSNKDIRKYVVYQLDSIPDGADNGQ